MSRCLCSFIAAFILAFASGTALAATTIEWRRHPSIKMTCPTISVDPSGGGNFKTIQSAIDSVAQFRRKWICIRIKEGVYREKLYIPADRPYIYLAGAGQTKTYVVSDGHDPFDSTATFTSRAENIAVEGISFNNSYNAIGSRNSMTPAAAAKIEGDKSAFYDCGFFGLQDTLWDSSGRHYFKRCTIEGAVDFIFGSGQSIYERSVISVIAKQLNGAPGYITAHARDHPDETNGFIFKHCRIIGNGRTFLGRPWRKYARVFFYRTFMSRIILPRGWNAWYNAGGDEDKLSFEEINCRGPGSNTTRRVRWVNKRMKTVEVRRFVDISYINDGGWILPEMINR